MLDFYLHEDADGKYLCIKYDDSKETEIERAIRILKENGITTLDFWFAGPTRIVSARISTKSQLANYTK